MEENREYKNFRLEVDGENIAWLYFDAKGESANILSKEVLTELDDLITIIGTISPKGLIILSGKKNGFIAGANIKEFTKINDTSEALALIERGQNVFNRFENLPFLKVCTIHGFCLGGGLELALACDYRIADADGKTRLGLPEVQLGIHPGFGGTVRLPRLIGALNAMDLMLTGKTIDAKKAKKIGLVTYAVPFRHLKSAARNSLLNPPGEKISFQKIISNNPIVRPLLKPFFLRTLKKKILPAHYPAPFEIVKLWAKHWDDRENMFRQEAISVSNLITGSRSKNLVRAFFLREKLKGLSKGIEFKASHVHVVGAGVMGGDIASWCVLRGLTVTLEDREAKYIAPAIKRAHDLFTKQLKTPILVRNAMDRLIPDIGGAIGIKKADVVIEAIFENGKAKQELFRKIEPLVKPHTILASNTSSIPLEEITLGLTRRERLVGLHFFNPVSKMPLVEVISSAYSAKEEIERAIAFTVQIDRLPLPVKSAPGFLVNRVLMPYLMEAVALFEEGVPPEVIDRHATNFGMPMGPIFLADTVGLDICLHVAEILSEKLATKVPETLKDMVGKGILGKKTGKGFYAYKKGQPQMSRKLAASKTPDIVDRLILSLVNECVACLKEGIVEDMDMVDAGVIFGTGFAPFRGGPMSYCKAEGSEAVISRLKKLESSYGERFKPSDGWTNLSF